MFKKFFTKEVIFEGDYGFTKTGTEVRVGRIVTCIVAFVIVLCLVCSCCQVVPAGHTGVVSTFGKVSEDVLQEGFNFVMPWQKVTKMDNRIVKIEIATEAFSSDLQTVSVDLAVNYRVDPSKSYYLIKNIGKSYEDVLITPAVHEVMKSIVANYTAENSIANRNAISLELRDELCAKLEVSGIHVDDINIIDFDFNDTYITAIEAKQVAEQQRLQAEIDQEKLTMEEQAKANRKVIEAKAAADVAKIEAEADAEVVRINADAAAYAGEKEAEINAKIAASLTDTLVEYQKIEQWDGKLPGITGADSVITMAS